MRAMAMEIRDNNREKSPLFGDQTLLRDALCVYVRMRWPTNTAKHAAREFGLTLDQGRALSRGSPSISTMDEVWRSPNGGWKVALPVMGAVIGEPVDQFIQSERRKHVEQAQRERSLLRDLRALAPGRHHPADELGSANSREGKSFRE